jgi:uncharacterized protein (TIGR03437 family)
MRTWTALGGLLTLSLASAGASTLGRDGVAAFRQLPGLNSTVLTTAPDGSVVIGGAATAAGLPVTDNAIEKTYGARTCIAGGTPFPEYPCNDGYIARFAPDGTLVYGSYIAGGGDVAVAGVTVGAGGVIYAVLAANKGVGGIPNPPSMDGATHPYVVSIATAQAGFGEAFMVAEAPRFTVSAMAVDATGNLYLGGSCVTGTLAATAGAFQPQASRSGQACALSYAPGSSTARYATYLGDSQTTVTGLVVDTQGDAYFAGATMTANVPGIDNGWNGVSGALAGPASSFSYVLALDAAGASVLWSAVFGSPDGSGAIGLLRNSGGDIVAIGITEFLPQFSFNSDLTPVRPVEVVKFSGNPRQPVYAVRAAEGADPSSVAAALADDGSVLLTGMTLSLAAGGLNSPQLATTGDALERCISGQRTRFFERLASADGSVEYASYFGADQQSISSGAAAGPNDSAYLLAGGVTSLDLTYYGGTLESSPTAGSALLLLSPASAPLGERLCAVNAANSRPDALAAGSVITLFGSSIGPAGVIAAEPDAEGNYPTGLAGTTVLLNGSPIPLLAVSQNQVNAVLPVSVTASGEIEVRTSSASQSLAVDLRSAAPALFGRLGLVAAVAFNADGTANGPANPAPRGSTVTVYGTGFGTPAQVPAAFVANQAVSAAVVGQDSSGVVLLSLTIPADLPPAFLQVAPISFQQGSLILNTGLYLWVQ